MVLKKYKIHVVFYSGKGSFDFVMKGIDRLLSKTSIHISIQVAVDKQNIDSYENLLEYMNTHYPFGIAGLL